MDPSSPEWGASCQPLGEPAAQQACQNAPCSLSFWLPGSWGLCAAGQQTRPVTCVDSWTRQNSSQVNLPVPVYHIFSCSGAWSLQPASLPLALKCHCLLCMLGHACTLEGLYLRSHAGAHQLFNWGQLIISLICWLLCRHARKQPRLAADSATPSCAPAMPTVADMARAMMTQGPVLAAQGLQV